MDHVSTHDHGNGVAVLSADRPPANAMDLALLDEIAEAVQRFAGDPPRALVLAGRPGFFSAGVDLKLAPTYGPEDRRRMVAAINAMALGVYELPCPIVGAITGHAVAGGLVLALCTDLRVASSAGRYGLTEVQVGIGSEGRDRNRRSGARAARRAQAGAGRRALQRRRLPTSRGVRRAGRTRRRPAARARAGHRPGRLPARGLRTHQARAACRHRRSPPRGCSRGSTARDLTRPGAPRALPALGVARLQICAFAQKEASS